MLILSSTAEYRGAETPHASRRVPLQAEELEASVRKGEALLTIVHESFALLAQARPVAWLLSPDRGEVTEWMRRQALLLRVIDSVGAAPPLAPPTGLREEIEKIVGAVKEG